MPNLTTIPAPRVSLLDERTGLISREWYRFLLNVYTKASDSTDEPTTLTVGPSPFTYKNELGSPVDVMVSGGGISKLQFTRNGSSFYSTGSFYGMFTLSPGDAIKVFYVAAPTMVVIPR